MNKRPQKAILAPSLLAGDHANLAGSAHEITKAGLAWAHVDIMDGHFVPNLTFGPQMVADLKKHEPNLFYDVHLMLDQPWLYTEAFVKAGACLVSIHIEPDYDHVAELKRIRSMGAKCGIVINPGTSIEALDQIVAHADLVLVMTVQPGRGGQPFRNEMLPKVETLARWKQERGLDYHIEVDGGVDLRTAELCKKAGANVLVAGTSFFRAENKLEFAEAITA
jgi:ribulose-phosphate 3-epimerase